MGILADLTYKAIFKRSPNMIFVGIIGAVILERFIDFTSLEIYHRHNQGKLWDDIRHKYDKPAE